MIVTTRFLSIFQEKMGKEIDALTEALATGVIGAEGDASTVGMKYMQIVGRLNGLNQALALADEVNTEMNR